MPRKTEKIGTCKLCLRTGVKRSHSHVLPEFLYEHTYDEHHRAIAVDPRPGARDRLLQKGLREYMLCADCEGHLAKFERSAADVLRSLPSTEHSRPGDVVRIRGLDYTAFKVFQLSMLWRCSVAEQASFHAVKLGPHEEEIRKMVLEGRPGRSWEYGCVIAALRGPGSLRNMVKFPGTLRLDGHYGYHMVLWGLVWVYVASKHSHRLDVKGLFLQKDGSLPIMVSSETVDGFLSGIAKELRLSGKGM